MRRFRQVGVPHRPPMWGAFARGRAPPPQTTFCCPRSRLLSFLFHLPPCRCRKLQVCCTPQGNIFHLYKKNCSPLRLHPLTACFPSRFDPKAKKNSLIFLYFCYNTTPFSKMTIEKINEKIIYFLLIFTLETLCEWVYNPSIFQGDLLSHEGILLAFFSLLGNFWPFLPLY